MKDFLLVALVLACPLMMILMMRGGHGQGVGHGHGGHRNQGHQVDAPAQPSTDELRRRRDDLDRLIEQREDEERDSAPTFAAPR